MRTLTLLICLLVPTAVALAQDKVAAPSQSNPYSTWNKNAYGFVKNMLLRSAEKMPEENYNFKPVDTVRSYGQIIGHLADSQYYFCSTALGDKDPDPKIEKTKTSKADLIAALKGAFAYCDKAYDSMTDTSGTQTVKLFGKEDTPKLSVLTVNQMHNLEHYGNLITYMRIKNIVPPTSEQAAQPQPKK
jgi:uncharacterized damage-inducible protein DinB